MADQPIDCTGTHFVSVSCTGQCGTWVVCTSEHSATAACLECSRAQAHIDWPWATSITGWHPSVGYPAPGSSGRVSEGILGVEGASPPDGGDHAKTVFATVNPDVVLGCLTCRHIWPTVYGLTDVQMVQAFADHNRYRHTGGVWLIGGPGGADNMCGPCGGGRGREKRPDGPDHTLCQRGRGGVGNDCGCVHRTPEERDAMVGKVAGKRWKPPRWSDPAVVAVAVENVQQRWEQLHLIEEAHPDASPTAPPPPVRGGGLGRTETP